MPVCSRWKPLTRCRLTGLHEVPANDAVQDVFDAHYGILVGWAAGLVGDRDLAHDVVAEAFARLLRHWVDVDDPRAWLFTTTANIVRDYWRKHAREARAYQRLQAGKAPLHDSGVDQATRLSLRAAVESLPRRQRMPVLLYYYADLPVAQVARQLGRSEGTVKRDLYDARDRLATLLDGG